MKTKEIKIENPLNVNIKLLFEVFAEANIWERIVFCFMYLFNPKYLLERWEKYRSSDEN